MNVEHLYLAGFDLLVVDDEPVGHGGRQLHGLQPEADVTLLQDLIVQAVLQRNNCKQQQQQQGERPEDPAMEPRDVGSALTGMSDGVAELQHRVQGCREDPTQETWASDQQQQQQQQQQQAALPTVLSQRLAGGDAVRVGDHHGVPAQVVFIRVGESQSGAEEPRKCYRVTELCFVTFFSVISSYIFW